jgi:hypothetical protein
MLYHAVIAYSHTITRPNGLIKAAGPIEDVCVGARDDAMETGQTAGSLISANRRLLWNGGTRNDFRNPEAITQQTRLEEFCDILHREP